MNRSEVLSGLGYSILSVLKETANAHILLGYLGAPRVPGQEVAIKAIPITSETESRQTVIDREKIDLVITESITAQALLSDHIVQVLEFVIDQTEGYGYIIQEYLKPYEFMPITEYLKWTTLSFDEIVIIFEKVAIVVEEASQKGFLHQDIKPGNILIGKNADGELQVKLSDFGAAQSKTDANKIIDDINTHYITGTKAFASPERLFPKPGNRIDLESEIFSIGASIFAILLDRTYFEYVDVDHLNAGTSYKKELYKIYTFHQEYPFLQLFTDEEFHLIREKGLKVSALTEFFVKTIGKLEDRYSSVDAFLDGLRACQSHKHNGYHQRVTDIVRNLKEEPTQKNISIFTDEPETVKIKVK